ncbi:phosphate acetyltransferase, partial [Francisella tularensis subsp. holarctica]|nr:phosphate acetyltransferase [Francisella tularensis subsp. holarctica]
RELPVIAQKGLNLIGVVEWQQEKSSTRILDIKNILKLNLISRVSLEARVDIVMMCSRGVDNFINDLTPNSLVITSDDR